MSVHILIWKVLSCVSILWDWTHDPIVHPFQSDLHHFLKPLTHLLIHLFNIFFDYGVYMEHCVKDEE